MKSKKEYEKEDIRFREMTVEVVLAPIGCRLGKARLIVRQMGIP